jgi:hypothetical protein
MSNTTISVSQASEEARMADIRRQEEAERRARLERERSAQALNQLFQQEERLHAIQASLDNAGARLPDLRQVSAFDWREPPNVKAGAAQLERHLTQMRKQLDTFERDVKAAINHAEFQLQRREATAATWRAIQDAETQWRMSHQAMAVLSQRLGQKPRIEAMPTRPAKNAELETVQAHSERLQAAITKQTSALATARSELLTLARAGETAGTAVTGVCTAQASLAQHHAESVAQAHARFEASLVNAMASNAVRSEDLPVGLHRLIDGARQMSAENDWGVSLQDWMAREASRRRDTARALLMLSSPPEGVMEDSALSLRWQQLTPHLQAVMAGHETMSSELEAEFAQLGRDAQRQLNYRLSRAAWFARMASQGLEVVEREDGKGLVVIDLTCPETWLEAQEFEGENGEFAATLELMTDAAPGTLDEEAQTASVCERLGKASGQNADKVKAESEVVERKKHITRARKPALKAQAKNF